MELKPADLDIQRIGACRIHSPISGAHFVDDGDHVVLQSNPAEIQRVLAESGHILAFEKAGPREKIYFDPSKLKCGIVTCGGLCPGLNDVIRAIVLSLFHHYGVRNRLRLSLRLRGAHLPLRPRPRRADPGAPSAASTNTAARSWAPRAGTRTSAEMVDTLDRMNIGILFAIGGDGTLRGAQAISEEIQRRGLKIGVIGIPKTIDNDISYVERSFGFETAVSEAVKAIDAAHTEAKGARNGIGLVKLMGRESGFIAAYAALARSDVNFCLIPEVPFALDELLGSAAGPAAAAAATR